MEHLGAPTPKEQKKLEEINVDLMMNGIAGIYMSMVGRCFTHCINDLTSKSLSGKEEKCLKTCGEKFMKYQQRVDLRYGEESANLQ
ncbi:hypothetical protein BZA70DRAFT_289037 [Myxozyma melibiosi]|uniref:Mitochondrial import inner membrane translocase subunit n=1 Tax=Myxozyma melibiosi TaxID=54550 RepID=A0ABR1F7M3_9ASCO